MKWLAAMTMATQIASAAVGVTASAQTAPALTPQQKARAVNLRLQRRGGGSGGTG